MNSKRWNNLSWNAITYTDIVHESALGLGTTTISIFAVVRYLLIFNWIVYWRIIFTSLLSPIKDAMHSARTVSLFLTAILFLVECPLHNHRSRPFPWLKMLKRQRKTKIRQWSVVTQWNVQILQSKCIGITHRQQLINCSLVQHESSMTLLLPFLPALPLYSKLIIQSNLSLWINILLKVQDKLSTWSYFRNLIEHKMQRKRICFLVEKKCIEREKNVIKTISSHTRDYLFSMEWPNDRVTEWP